jgi:hypothetical protein
MNIIKRYNTECIDHAIGLLQKEFKSLRRMGPKSLGFAINTGDKDAHFKIAWDRLNVVRSSSGFKKGDHYLPFDILVEFGFKGNIGHAITFLVGFFNKDVPFIRVNDNYYKVVPAGNGDSEELIHLLKSTIKDDYGADIFPMIAKYDKFCMEPNNIDWVRALGNKYNKYTNIGHVSKEFDVNGDLSEINWSLNLLHHLFQDKFALGLEYMQVLYLLPKQAMPIVVFGSKERETGKSTFNNWMRYIYGGNSASTDVKSMKSSFNSHIAEKLVISIEETISDSLDLVNDLKNLSTAKFLTVNEKFVKEYDVDFYGKFIVYTNEPDKFLVIDKEETRFWVNLVPSLGEKKDDRIYEYLQDEIPYFLHYLKSLPMGVSRGRMWFSPAEIETEQLRAAKKESVNALEYEINDHLDNFCSNHPKIQEICFTSGDLNQKFYGLHSKHSLKRIGGILRSIGYVPKDKPTNYYPFDSVEVRCGKYFTYENPYFTGSAVDIEVDDDDFFAL